MEISQISTPFAGMETQKNDGVIKSLYTEKLTPDETKELREAVELNANKFTFQSVEAQKELSVEDKFQQDYEEFQAFLKDIGYDGKPIAELSQDEAKELVSDDGFFGIDKTSQRVADFVINGANGDEELLRAGREGVLQGYEDAKEMWGGELPEISQKTVEKTLELIDQTMAELGYSVLDTKA